MGRIPTSEVQRIARAVSAHLESAPGATLEEIARAVGISVPAAARYRAGRVKGARGIDMALLYDRAIAMKSAYVAEGKRVSTLTIMSELCKQYGYCQSQFPSASTFDNWFYNREVPLSVRRSTASSAGNGRYWFEKRPDAPGQRVLLDTATVRVGPQHYTLIVWIDYVSRGIHIDLVPKQYAAYLAHSYDRMRRTLGFTPELVQSDNSVILAPSYLYQVSPIVRYAFSQGTKRWEYVPIAEAFRNGRVERVIQTIKNEFERIDHVNETNALNWLAQWQDNYNHHRFHSGISSRKKGGLRTPNDITPLNTYVIEPLSIIKAPTRVSGLVGYKRIIVDGIMDFQYPDFKLATSSALDGHYATLWVNTANMRATLEFIDPQGNVYAIGDIHIRNGMRTAKLDISRSIQDRFPPVPIDTYHRMKSEAKITRGKLPKPGATVKGCIKILDGAYFRIICEYTGEVLYDSTCNRIPDHIGELFGVTT